VLSPRALAHAEKGLVSPSGSVAVRLQLNGFIEVGESSNAAIVTVPDAELHEFAPPTVPEKERLEEK
jgi:hypothetical protein